MERFDLTDANLVAAVSGSARNACAAVCGPDGIVGVCEQERITRVRAAGANATGLPDEALDEILRRAGRSRRNLVTLPTTDATAGHRGVASVVDHHFAHAWAAYAGSPFESAAIVVCDHEAPQVSVWDAEGASVAPVEWPWRGVGFAELYSQCAVALEFSAGGKEQRMEALARLAPSVSDTLATTLLRSNGEGLELANGWVEQIASLANGGSSDQKAALAAALQTRIGDLLEEFINRVRQHLPNRTKLCVGGSLFYNSYLNSRVKASAAFADVFVPINPGNAGNALGIALQQSRRPRQAVSPFLGPRYTPEEIKATLDNCKLTYNWVSDTESVAIAVEALERGALVAWFDDAMEWGPRALGARSIVASPFAPYLLENLNHFLKKREPWRGYALSGRDSAIHEYFDGPRESPFMECDFVPRDRERFRHVLPSPNATVRLQTVNGAAPPRFQALLDAFGQASGIPVLVNTSFNGFNEPIVCSPRDAIRVFFGTGIDVLVLGQFVVTK